MKKIALIITLLLALTIVGMSAEGDCVDEPEEVTEETTQVVNVDTVSEEEEYNGVEYYEGKLKSVELVEDVVVIRLGNTTIITNLTSAIYGKPFEVGAFYEIGIDESGNLVSLEESESQPEAYGGFGFR